MSTKRVTDILRAALALPPDQRSAYIALRCGGDTALRDQVYAALESQLAATMAGEPGTSTLDAASGADPATLSRATAPLDAAPAGDVPLRRLGRYRILRVLGEGGMGVVYLAQQDHPQRLVALKVIRGGALSPRALRRFELESQVLARLQHPGIAQVYEAGTAAESSSDGRSAGLQVPFFAMEYIQGVPVTDYANAHHLDTRQRLDLFTRICDAVHHAHQKGVVHRDLKPGNILVDISGQPKVLDFGVARTLDGDAAAQLSMHTDAGQLLGTVPYMSPEQVSASGADTRDVDTRSDVYTLGVILFELLVGRLPHDVAGASVPEAVRAIAQDEAARLSVLDRSLRGDIDTIAGKALEKDRARRYQSASELAEDIRRSLRDEPISARPPSRSYQLSKFAKRNKGLVAGVVAAFVVLIAGAAATSALAVVARRNEARAEQAAADAMAVTEFLQTMLASANPD
ncbi:MAG TPA: serine/threonine-protein kinase, partial [Phycisphaerales bacterium]|nr:serine/threonine-protein kinase [Phycisphaerales bacterium]